MENDRDTSLQSWKSLTLVLPRYYATVSIAETPTPELMFTASCLVTMCTLVALGAAKAKLTAQPAVESALGMVVNGGAAAVAAYIIGHVLEGFQHSGSVEGASPVEPRAPPCVGDTCPKPWSVFDVFDAFKAGGSGGDGESGASPGLVASEALVAAAFAAVGALPCVFLSSSPSLVKYSNAAAGGAVASIAVALAVDASRDSPETRVQVNFNEWIRERNRDFQISTRGDQSSSQIDSTDLEKFGRF